MKTLRLVFFAIAVSSSIGCASSTDEPSTSTDDADLRSDPCRAKALDAAEAAYDSYINRTSVKTVKKGEEYLVTVGIGNPEDGPHQYDVTFAESCSSKPKVEDVTE